MSNADETSLIERAEAWLQTPAGRSVLTALGRVLDAVEREKTAGRTEAVVAAQEIVISALSDLRVATGAEGLLLRRVGGFALDKPRATDAEVKRIVNEVLSSPDATSEPQQRRVRAMFMRAVIDAGLLPEKIARSAAWATFLSASGRFSHHGGVWARVKTVGVKPHTGALETAKVHLMYRTGYTAGAEGNSITRRLTSSILSRAQALWKKMRRNARTDSLPAVSTDTIRKWCNSRAEPLSLGAQFKLAYDQGKVDRAANTIDRRRLLPP
jgi:hypothetical protein